MPEFRGMRCSIEVDNQPLLERHVQYDNQSVECLTYVPSQNVDFSIRFAASYAPGFAVFVFIDGQYQANRIHTSGSPHIDFRLRQKEEPLGDGRTFVGRGWRFASVKTGPSEALTHVDSDFLYNVGTIEVAVLRCVAADLHQPSYATDMHVSDPSVEDARTNHRRRYEEYSKRHPVSSSHGMRTHSLCGLHTTPVLRYGSSTGVRGVGHVYEHKHAERTHASAAFKPSTESAHNSMDSKAKPYWLALNVPSNSNDPTDQDGDPMARNPYIMQAHAQPVLDSSFLASRGVNVQVITGQGAPYSHPLARPHYLDSMAKPFSVFTFYYRRPAPHQTLNDIDRWLENSTSFLYHQIPEGSRSFGRHHSTTKSKSHRDHQDSQRAASAHLPAAHAASHHHDEHQKPVKGSVRQGADQPPSRSPRNDVKPKGGGDIVYPTVLRHEKGPTWYSWVPPAPSYKSHVKHSAHFNWGPAAPSHNTVDKQKSEKESHAFVW